MTVWSEVSDITISLLVGGEFAPDETTKGLILWAKKNTSQAKKLITIFRMQHKLDVSYKH